MFPSCFLLVALRRVALDSSFSPPSTAIRSNYVSGRREASIDQRDSRLDPDRADRRVEEYRISGGRTVAARWKVETGRPFGRESVNISRGG